MFLFLLIEVISKIRSASYHFEIHLIKHLPDSLEEKQVDMFVTSRGSLFKVYLKLIIVSYLSLLFGIADYTSTLVSN